ncbi:hypothetical protein CABS02_14991 [Colletotrichum abscissum]|uniref:Uncharacterized protein n=1 Tax=Colletotrichum abscissum TaxID=1671311 RepID=A0A9P9X098_9PEZI|nr:hypothetical protein CABS02_14991 [Colletotrichum abscissum]
MDLEPDSTSITVAREVTAASDEDLASRRWPAGDHYSSRKMAKERVKPVEEDDKGLLLTMGKQVKELHAAIKIMFDAWKKSETWSKNVEAELRVVTSELQTR